MPYVLEDHRPPQAGCILTGPVAGWRLWRFVSPAAGSSFSLTRSIDWQQPETLNGDEDA